MGGILSRSEIAQAWSDGDIRITNFDHSRLNPASYDLRLGSKVAVYSEAVMFSYESGRYKYYYHAESKTYRSVFGDKELDLARDGISDLMHPYPNYMLSVHEKHDVSTFEMKAGKGWLLKPGIGYLMHTEERISTDKYVPILDGKSSLGRLFMTAHVTAGYGDPGFDGQYTLEVVVTHPVLVFPGMRFCQIRFHTLVGVPDSYKQQGHYVGQAAEGPVPSMSWKQFAEERDAENSDGGV